MCAYLAGGAMFGCTSAGERPPPPPPPPAEGADCSRVGRLRRRRLPLKLWEVFEVRRGESCDDCLRSRNG